MPLTALLQNLDIRIPSHLVTWQRGMTPLSTWPSVILTIFVYLILLYGIHDVMKARRAMQLKTITQLHNLLLSFFSFILLVLTVKEVFPMIYNHGFHYGICSPNARTPVGRFWTFTFLLRTNHSACRLLRHIMFSTIISSSLNYSIRYY